MDQPKIVTRKEWGARTYDLSSKYVAPSKRTEFFVHYDGGAPVTRTGYSIPKAIERFHMDDRGWAAPGYNYVIESNPNSPTDGVIYELRGRDIQGAHCPNHNISGIGVQVAIGAAQRPTVKALESLIALYDWCSAASGKQLAKKGHRDGKATECPGTSLYYFVTSGFSIPKTLAAGHAVGEESDEENVTTPPEVVAGGTPEAFIEVIAPIAQYVQRKFFVPASVAIAQAALETGWGKSSLSQKANNYFGIKNSSIKSPYQNGAVSKETLEYIDGEATTVVDAFRSYVSIQDGFLDYGSFLYGNSRYWGAFRSQLEPTQFITEVHKAGYATDPLYSNKVIDIIKRYNLTQYDIAVWKDPSTGVVLPPVIVPEPEPAPTPAPEPAPAPTPTPAPTPEVDQTDRHIPTTYPYTDTLTLQRLIKAASVEVLTGEDYNHRLQALACLKNLAIVDRMVPNQNEKWVDLFRSSWKKWQEKLGFTGAAADGVPGARSVYELAVKAKLKYWDNEKNISVPEDAPPAPAPAFDGTDRHIPSVYPYTDTLTLQRLVKAANTEVLIGEDYNHRLQALACLKNLALVDRIVPNHNEKWVDLFRSSWKKWQESLGFSGADADGVPGARSVYELAVKAKLKYWDSEKRENSLPPVSDGTDRHIPSTYPYTDTLTLQRLVKAASTEVLTGEDYNHRLQALTSLKALGHITRQVPAQGEKWTVLFRTAWRKWQESLGFTGSDADGIPGATSVYTLAKRVGLKYWDNVKKTSTLTTSSTSPGLPTTGVSTSKVNPTQGGRITTPFGKYPKNNTYWRAFGRHTGADFGRSSTSGSAIYAVDSGYITYRWDSVLGHIAILKADSLSNRTHKFFWYCHLAARPTTGRVKKGQKIGTMGATGSGAAGTHLHLELQKSGSRWGTAWSDFADPAPFLKQG